MALVWKSVPVSLLIMEPEIVESSLPSNYHTVKCSYLTTKQMFQINEWLAENGIRYYGPYDFTYRFRDLGDALLLKIWMASNL